MSQHRSRNIEPTQLLPAPTSHTGADQHPSSHVWFVPPTLIADQHSSSHVWLAPTLICRPAFLLSNVARPYSDLQQQISIPPLTCGLSPLLIAVQHSSSHVWLAPTMICRSRSATGAPPAHLLSPSPELCASSHWAMVLPGSSDTHCLCVHCTGVHVSLITQC